MSAPYRLKLISSEDKSPERFALLRDLVDKKISRVDHDKLLSVIEDADEELLWMLASQYSSYNTLGQHVNYQLTKKALELADSTGHIWTPLLDRISEGKLWRTAELYESPQQRGARLRQDKPAPKGLEKTLPEEAERLEPLVEWLREEATAEDLKALLFFKSETLAEVIGRNAQNIDTEALRSLLTTGPRAAVGFAQNESLSDEALAELGRWFYNHHRAVQRAARENKYSSKLMSEENVIEWFSTVAERGLPEDIRHEIKSRLHTDDYKLIFSKDKNASVAEIRNVGKQLRPEDVALILQTHPERETLLADFSMESKERWAWGKKREALIKLLTGSEASLSKKDLELILDVAGNDSEVARRVIWQENADIEILRRVAENSSGHVRKALGRKKEARRDSIIRKELEKSTSSDVKASLLEDANAEEFKPLFIAVAKSTPKKALTFLEDEKRPAGLIIDQELLAPLLVHGSREVRMAALTHLGEQSALAAEKQLGSDEKEQQKRQV